MKTLFLFAFGLFALVPSNSAVAAAEASYDCGLSSISPRTGEFEREVVFLQLSESGRFLFSSEQNDSNCLGALAANEQNIFTGRLETNRGNCKLAESATISSSELGEASTPDLVRGFSLSLKTNSQTRTYQCLQTDYESLGGWL